MCLSVPAKVIAIHGDEARVSVSGVVYTAGIQLLDHVEEGDFVLLHAGFAIQRIDEREARETLQLLREMGEQDKSP